MSCNCGRKCIAGSCSCIDSGLKCTELCKLKLCDNYDDDDDDDEDEIEYDSYGDDEDSDCDDDNSDED